MTTTEEKKLAIVREIVDLAFSINTNIKKARLQKRAFRKKTRTPKDRMIKQTARFALFTQPFITASNIHMISSQPIPKFPSGTKEKSPLSEGPVFAKKAN